MNWYITLPTIAVSDVVQTVASTVSAMLLFAGLYLLLAEAMRLPSLRSLWVIHSLVGQGDDMKLSDRLALPAAIVIERLVHLDQLRRDDLAKRLKATGMGMTPERYIALAVSFGLPLFLLGAIFIAAVAISAGVNQEGSQQMLRLLILLVGILFLCCGALLVYTKLQKVKKADQSRQSDLDLEFPRLTSAITQSLSIAVKDVAVMLRSYREIAGKSMRGELDVVLADMGTSDPESALLRWKSRLSNEHASLLIDALIGIHNGENMRDYLNGLQIEQNNWIITHAKEIAAKRPGEVTPGIWCLLGAMVLMIVFLIFKSIYGPLTSF